MASDMECVVMVAPDAFHLGWMGATQRLLHLAEAFRQLGSGVVLLAGRGAPNDTRLKVEDCFGGSIVRTEHSGYYPHLLEGRPVLKRAWRAGWKARGDDFYWERLSWGWAQRLSTQSSIESVLATGHRPAVVWGVSAGYLDGAVAAEALAQALDLPWVLELHDPPRGTNLGAGQPAIERRFSDLVQSASSVVVTSAAYGESLAMQFPILTGRLHVVHLSYDPLTSTAPRQSKDFTLTYTGSLDSGRSLIPLLLSLERLRLEDPALVAQLRLIVAGRGSGMGDVSRFADKSPLGPAISVLGEVSWQEAQRLQAESNASVVVQPRASSLQVPGKVFELLSQGKPIVGLVPSGSEVGDILKSSGLGLISEPDDVQGIGEVIEVLLKSWKEGIQAVTARESVIEQYSRLALPGKLAAILDQCDLACSHDAQWGWGCPGDAQS